MGFPQQAFQQTSLEDALKGYRDMMQRLQADAPMSKAPATGPLPMPKKPMPHGNSWIEIVSQLMKGGK